MRHLKSSTLLDNANFLARSSLKSSNYHIIAPNQFAYTYREEADAHFELASFWSASFWSKNPSIILVVVRAASSSPYYFFCNCYISLRCCCSPSCQQQNPLRQKNSSGGGGHISSGRGVSEVETEVKIIGHFCVELLLCESVLPKNILLPI